jgi:diacylglycerol kinase family enzyme
MEHALVIINPNARRGQGVRDYARIQSEVEARFHVRHALFDSPWRRDLDGVERVIAVGGDGTLNAVANAVLSSRPSVTLGAIGIGSSNDFHKPCHTRVRGVPVRIGAPVPRDVGLATFENALGVTQKRWFCVSASIGLVARANRRFAGGGGLAIARAATSALLRHSNVAAQVDGRSVAISNLSVMLTPYLAGAFRYGAEVPAGRFALHLCADMGRLGLFGEMMKLLRGRFGGESWVSPSLTVDLDREDDLELDGEVFRARSVRFETVPGALSVCS